MARRFRPDLPAPLKRWARQLWADLADVTRLAAEEKLTILLLWLLGFMLLGSVAFYLGEVNRNPNVNNYFDALYWSIVSITTVGYGDLAPTTPVARAASVLMLLSFMALMPLVGATITSIYVSKKIKGERGLETYTCRDHIVICGWNNNGHNILAGLEEQKVRGPVIIVGEMEQDHFENLLQAYTELDLNFVRGPYTSEATLRRANVKQAAVAMVLINYGTDSLLRSDETAVLAVLTIREQGPNVRIVAECFASAYRGHLRRAGADKVIVSGELDSYLLTAAALSPGLDGALRDAVTFGSGNDMWTIDIPEDFHGRTFRDLAVHWLENKGWILIGIIQEKREIGIKDVLGGESSSIDEFIKRSFEAAGKGGTGSQALHFLNPGMDHVLGPGDKAIVIYQAEADNA